MQRHELLELMATLQLSGMRAAFDEIVADGLRRQHAFHQMLGALLLDALPPHFFQQFDCFF